MKSLNLKVNKKEKEHNRQDKSGGQDVLQL